MGAGLPPGTRASEISFVCPRKLTFLKASLGALWKKGRERGEEGRRGQGARWEVVEGLGV